MVSLMGSMMLVMIVVIMVVQHVSHVRILFSIIMRHRKTKDRLHAEGVMVGVVGHGTVNRGVVVLSVGVSRRMVGFRVGMSRRMVGFRVGMSRGMVDLRVGMSRGMVDLRMWVCWSVILWSKMVLKSMHNRMMENNIIVRSRSRSWGVLGTYPKHVFQRSSMWRLRIPAMVGRMCRLRISIMVDSMYRLRIPPMGNSMCSQWKSMRHC